MIAVREFTTAAEVLSNAAAVRARIFNARPKEKPEAIYPTPITKVVRVSVAQQVRYAPPLRDYNAHVVAYRRWCLYLELKGQFTGIESGIAAETETKKTAEDVINEVLLFFPGVTISQVKGSRRQPDLVLARHVAVFEVCRKFPTYSLPMIGRIFGGKDHTSIMFARDKIAALGGVGYVRKQMMQSLRKHKFGSKEIARMMGEYA